MEGSLLAGLTAPFVLLEDRIADAPARLYSRPVDVVRCVDADGVKAAFEAIETGLARGFHAAGIFSYELGHVLEPGSAGSTPAVGDTPLIWVGLFEAPTSLDPQALDATFAGLGPPPPVTALRRGHDKMMHMEKVQAILRLIAAGDAYQVNLTFPLHFQYDGDPLRLYAALRAAQPVAHGGLAALGDMTVLSVSPELWVDVASDLATVRPMKGTSARGAGFAADQAARQTLAADPKQRAENLMIVDLLRNDLARLSKPGTVKVLDLFTVETYPSFHALTSTVTARLAPGDSLRDRVTALFPCGSVVGAPKIRASQIIGDLEIGPRGAYTGALGAAAPNGDMRFNVAIRTAQLWPDGRGRYGVGGGIIADSDPDAEYDEALLKGRVLTDLAQDYDLIETFRWCWTGGFVRLPLHLARLAGSARKFGFAFDGREPNRALIRLAQAWTSQTTDQRIRLTLSRSGRVELTHADAVAPPPILRLGVASRRLDPGDPFLGHKTTRREAYDEAYSDATAKGLDEALLLNRRGEVADASRRTVFARIDGDLVTPPLTAGVLPGVLRQALISSGAVVERRLFLQDLQSAASLWVGNSLHGLTMGIVLD